MADQLTVPEGMLDPDTAYGIVSQRVYAPRFFEKLAQDYNLRPQTEGEARQLLTMATRLRQAYDADQEKQAAARGSVISGAFSALEQRLGDAPQGTAVAERYYKQASANGARDPELARAVLSLQVQAAENVAA